MNKYLTTVLQISFPAVNYNGNMNPGTIHVLDHLNKLYCSIYSILWFYSKVITQMDKVDTDASELQKEYMRKIKTEYFRNQKKCSQVPNCILVM